MCIEKLSNWQRNLLVIKELIASLKSSEELRKVKEKLEQLNQENKQLREGLINLKI